MSKVLINLGIYSTFVRNLVRCKEYSNESQVVQEALKLFKEKTKTANFIKLINNGISSGISNNFDSKKYVKTIHSANNNNIFELTCSAVDDLKTIWQTETKRNESRADDYISSIFFCIRRIAQNPNSGIEYSKIMKGVFGVKMYRVPGLGRFKYLIYYRIINLNQIEIIRILSEHLDIKEYL